MGGVLIDDRFTDPLKSQIRQKLKELLFVEKPEFVQTGGFTDLEWRIATSYFLDPKAVENLHSIIQYVETFDNNTKVKIVISSAGREDGTHAEVIEKMFAGSTINKYIVDKIVDDNDVRNSYLRRCRDDKDFIIDKCKLEDYKIDHDALCREKYGYHLKTRADQVEYWLMENSKKWNVKKYLILDYGDHGFSQKFPRDFIMTNGFPLQNSYIGKCVRALLWIADIELLNSASRKGNVKLVKDLIENAGIKPTWNTLNCASKTDDLDYVKYLIEKCKIEYTQSTLYNFGLHGNSDIIKYLIHTVKLHPDTDTISAISASGNLDLIKYLVVNFKIKPNSDGMLYGSYSGNLDLIKYLIEQCRLPIGGSGTLNNAVQAGHFHVVHYFEEKGIPFDKNTLKNAIFGESLDMVRYLVEIIKIVPTFDDLSEAKIYSTRSDNALKVYEYMLRIDQFYHR